MSGSRKTFVLLHGAWHGGWCWRRVTEPFVYLDALLVESGQTPFSVVPAQTAESRRRLAAESSAGVSIPVPDPSAFGVRDATDAQWLRSRCTPHPISTYESALTLHNPLGNGLPATYVAVTPHYGPTEASRRLARRRAGTFAKSRRDTTR